MHQRENGRKKKTTLPGQLKSRSTGKLFNNFGGGWVGTKAGLRDRSLTQSNKKRSEQWT